jgi:chaperonin GroES
MSLKKVIDNISKVNIANDLDDELLKKIGMEVVKNFDTDRLCMAEWEEHQTAALKLAKQVKETKSSPWEGAANVKFPLLTVASIQFAARAYPEIVRATGVVKCDITGKDMDGSRADRASRIEVHMNYQLTKEMTEWEADTDQLLHILPIIGMVWRKTYYSQEKGRNVSELVLPNDCYVNQKARSEETARRISHRYYLYDNDIWEKQKSGIWLDVELSDNSNETEYHDDTDIPHEIIEQHRYYDLDEDGYGEPYIIWVHRKTSKVLRIVARYEENGIKVKDGKLIKIEPINYFVLYQFIPNPDGSIFSQGFGQLLEPINETVNTTINQLLDAGTMSNAGGGFIGRGIKIRGGVMSFQPNEWKLVETQGQDLQKNIVPLPVREPSPVLFQLLGFLVQGAKDISSVQDIIGGNAQIAANMPATTMMALIEQGLKVYVSIYKRIYRALTKELQNLYRLNSLYVDPQKYAEIVGANWKPENQVPAMGGELTAMQPTMDIFQDYRTDDITVCPVADPNMSTEMQRMAKIQAVMQLGQLPGVNLIELTRSAIRAINPPDVDKILMTDAQLAGQEDCNYRPGPSPEQVTAEANVNYVQVKAMDVQGRLQMDTSKLLLEMEEIAARIAKTRADAMLAIAKAESEELGPQMDLYKQEVNNINQELQTKIALIQKQQELAQAQQQAQVQVQQKQGVGGV